ncbi:helicase POLQ-like isoform X2 [Liolophura sinensis]|uniref:helicase POLQ-like isoform X2 n=1 Tax=Liolophura sinensis TaxID=3198878 RepID=UPI003158E73A
MLSFIGISCVTMADGEIVLHRRVHSRKRRSTETKREIHQASKKQDLEDKDVPEPVHVGCEPNNWLSNSFVKSPSGFKHKSFHQSSIRKPSQVEVNKDSPGNACFKICTSPPLRRSPRTPTPSSAGSLQDRIKQRLQKNALVQSPTLSEQKKELQEQMICQAQQDARELHEQVSDTDIGPFFGLPTKVQRLIEEHRGIKKLYDWQTECLNLPAVKEAKNLIYCLPTSGGKTLVAEILILRELLCKKRDALLILPFVSIVQEKVRNLSALAVELGFLVEEYAGSKGRFPPIKRQKSKSLYIATIEKAHSLVNSLLEHGRINNVGLVVVDELHMLGDRGSRGATLEMTLVKLLHACEQTQIVGMSATLSNISDFKTFLSADMYTNNFRPVELTEYIKVEDTIYRVNKDTLDPSKQLEHERVVMFQYTADMKRLDSDQLFGLATEVIPQHSCLVFCPTKKNCENVATNLCKMMSRFKRSLAEHKRAERKVLLRELHDEGNGNICPVLRYCVQFGVAYHHSGLTMDERKLIEEAYSDGVLCLLTCTSTLAAGVNLPAKRVILRLPYVGQQFLSRSQYKQMVGRAGRAGIDSTGESIMITPHADKKKVHDLLFMGVEGCYSSLMYNEGKGLRGLILSTIGLKVTPNTLSLAEFMQKTLLNKQNEVLKCDVAQAMMDALENLIELGLVQQKKDDCRNGQEDVRFLEVTPLGKATFKGSVDLEYSQRLYNDLQKAKDSLVLSNYLHLLFLVTPYETGVEIKPCWMTYFTQMNNLDPTELRVADLIGVPEGYIAKMASGQSRRQSVDSLTVKRFYLTLMLYNLWKKKTIWEVAAIFQQPRGFLQNLLTGAASFASCVFHFCQEIKEFWAFPDLLSNFIKTLSYCVSLELLPLMEIPGVKQGRAKQLLNAGYKSLSLVAQADPDKLVKIIENFPRRQAKQILLNEKLEAMLGEYEDLMSIPMTLPDNKVTAEGQMSKPTGTVQNKEQTSPAMSWISNISQSASQDSVS